MIAGASGLIGRALINLIDGTWKVFALSRRLPRWASSRQASWISLDLAGGWRAEALPRRIDTVIYLAQSPFYRDFPGQAEHIFQVNTMALLRFLEYARRSCAQNFILASSGGVQAEEDNCLHFYRSTKLCAELLSQNYAAFMKIIILRFFFVYGFGQKEGMLIPRLIRLVQQGKPVILYGKGGIRINPIHASDAARAIYRAALIKKSYKADIAGPKAYAMRQIAEIIGKAVKREPVFKVRPRGSHSDILGDISSMKKILGSPKILLEEGIRSVI